MTRKRPQSLWLLLLCGGVACGISERVVEERQASGTGGGGGRSGTSMASAGVAAPAGASFAGQTFGGTSAGGALGIGAGPQGGKAGIPGFPGAGGKASVSSYCDDKARAPLPLIVTDFYATSGYYDLSSSELSRLADCTDRPTNARGACLAFAWSQSQLHWVGLLLQYPADNWFGPGLCLEEGARSVTFWLKGEGTALAKLEVLGLTQYVTPTSTWVQYGFDITGIDYNRYVLEGGVRGAFSLVLERDPQGFAAQTLYVDDIRWNREPFIVAEGGADAGGAGGAE